MSDDAVDRIRLEDVQALQDSIARSKHSPYMFLRLSSLLDRLGHREEAQKVIHAGHEAYPGHLGIIQYLVETNRRAGRISEAVTWAKLALKVAPDRRELAASLAHLQLHAEYLDEAERTLEAALAVWPGDAGLRGQLSHVRSWRRISMPWLPFPQSDDPDSPWRRHHEAMRKSMARLKPRVVFIGDSITNAWESAGAQTWKATFAQLPAVNLGMAGDMTQNVIWRVEQDAFAGIIPDVVVLLIGTNNLPHLSADKTVKGIVAAIESLENHLPSTKIIVLGLLPRGHSPDDPYRGKIVSVNQQLAIVCSERGHPFADLGNLLLEADGRLPPHISPDGLHLSDTAYRNLAPKIESLIQIHLRGDARPQRLIRCAVVGNSNSIPAFSYAAILSREAGFQVDNFSIGGCPNALLMHFLSRADIATYDYIIAETSVIDASLGLSGFYSRAEAEAVARQFIAAVRRSSDARIVFLVLPIHEGLVRPGDLWVRDLYHDMAKRSGARILDGYELVERICGPAHSHFGAGLTALFEPALRGFRLDANHAKRLLFSTSTLARLGFPVLGRHMFADELHISGGLHMMIARLLATMMLTDRTARDAPSTDAEKTNAEPPVLAITPDPGPRLQQRSSHLISREMAVLGQNEEARFSAPRGYRLMAMLINQSATCAFVHIRSETREFTIDLRHGKLDRDYRAIVVPITEDLGDGPFVVRATSGNNMAQTARRYWPVDATRENINVEVAELVVSRRDLISGKTETATGDDGNILNLVWFAREFEMLLRALMHMIVPQEEPNIVLNRRLLEDSFAVGSEDAGLPATFVLARLAFIAGDFRRAAQFLRDAQEQASEDRRITELIAAVDRINSALAASRANAGSS